MLFTPSIIFILATKGNDRSRYLVVPLFLQAIGVTPWKRLNALAKASGVS
jgi:hypothetical protein